MKPNYNSILIFKGDKPHLHVKETKEELKAKFEECIEEQKKNILVHSIPKGGDDFALLTVPLRLLRDYVHYDTFIVASELELKNNALKLYIIEPVTEIKRRIDYAKLKGKNKIKLTTLQNTVKVSIDNIANYNDIGEVDFEKPEIKPESKIQNKLKITCSMNNGKVIHVELDEKSLNEFKEGKETFVKGTYINITTEKEVFVNPKYINFFHLNSN